MTAHDALEAMYLHQGPIVHALSSRPPYSRHWRSYVVLPQPRWSGEKLMAPKTRPALPVPADAPSWVIGRRIPVRSWVTGTRWSFNDMVQEAEEKAMTVHDAEPGDVFVDDGGKLWRCVSVCHEPTVTMEEVEGHTSTTPDPMVMQAAGAQQYRAPVAPPIIRDRRGGGVSGLMWNGWKRIWRKEEPDAAHAKTSPGPVNCQTRLRFQNLTMPKTCERCGLGPCPFFNKDGTRRVT